MAKAAKTGETVKSIFAIPVKLKKKLQYRAVDEGCNMQDIVTKALEQYLSTPLPKK